MSLTSAEFRDLLPERYKHYWRDPFDERIERRLRPGAAVLDVGSGRRPAVPADRRPERVHYVGLDLSRTELEAAAPGAYQEMVVSDAATPVPALRDRFDLALSWEVLEHVKPLGDAVDNVFSYLKPGASFISLFSGTFSAFGVVNRLLPHSLGRRLVSRAMRRNASTPVFPAYYDRCYSSALRRLFASWSEVEIVPFYRGANYFHYSTALTRLYLAYENLAERRRLANLATYYLVEAVR